MRKTAKGGDMASRDELEQEAPREDEPNPTQEEMGDGEDKPVDASWSEDEWGDLPEESPLA
jgi:hypothetical protein